MSNDKNKQINVLADNFINPQQVKIIHDNLGLHLSEEHILTLKEWGKLFIEYNLHTNLMSKNEVVNLFEKHIYDSLSIVLWDKFHTFKDGGKLLDIGTGGGFPSVILAITFDGLTVVANDSRSRKTKFIELAKKELNLKNLQILTERAEILEPQNADIVTFRAVGKIKDTLPLAKKHLKNNKYAVFYKAKDVALEINEALGVYSDSHKETKNTKIIPYSLPVDIQHVRNLAIIKI